MKHSNKKLYTPLRVEPLKVKRFVAGFDFPNPDWSSLPEGFPELDKQGLTKEEGHLLDGVKLAWTASEGRELFYKRIVKKAMFGTVIVVLILAGTALLSKPDKSLAKNVSAKTVSTTFEEFVEATMSAVFRK